MGFILVRFRLVSAISTWVIQHVCVHHEAFERRGADRGQHLLESQCHAQLSLATNLGAPVAALGPQLVDLCLSDVRSLLSLVQLMLQLTELAQVAVGLFLLFPQGCNRSKANQVHYKPLRDMLIA